MRTSLCASAPSLGSWLAWNASQSPRWQVCTHAPWVTGGRGWWVCWIGRIGRISSGAVWRWSRRTAVAASCSLPAWHQEHLPGAPGRRYTETFWVGFPCGSSTICPRRVNSGWTSCNSSRIPCWAGTAPGCTQIPPPGRTRPHTQEAAGWHGVPSWVCAVV